MIPLITTYFASLTTTALAAAYAGQAGASEQAIAYLAVTLILAVILAGWHSVADYYEAALRMKIISSVTDNLTTHFLSLNFARYDDRTMIEQFDRATLFARQSGYILSQLTSFLTAIISVLAAFISLLLISWWLGLILVAAMVPSLMVQIRASRDQLDYRNKTTGIRRKWGYLDNILSDVSVVAEIRIYQLVKYLMKMRAQFRHEAEEKGLDIEKRFIRYRIVTYGIQTIAEAFALIYTVLQIAAHKLPIGQFVYVQQVISRTINSVTNLSRLINSLDEIVGNLFDYTDFLELPTDRQRPIQLKQMPKVISLQHVGFSYPDRTDTEVLKDVTFDIKKGQKVALVGENGAGKTTLVKLILGLYLPTKGNIIIDNTNIDRIKPSSWHQFVSAMMQNNQPFRFANIRDNVWFGDISRTVDDADINKALSQAEAKEFVDQMPSGLDSYLTAWITGKKGRNTVFGNNLSGGQMQRLMLARNFYRNSPFVILDEPTSAIDALAESRIFRRLFAEKSKTMLIISHRLTTVEQADIIYVLKDGRIVESGSHAELVAKRGEYYHIFESQINPSVTD